MMMHATIGLSLRPRRHLRSFLLPRQSFAVEFNPGVVVSLSSSAFLTGKVCATAIPAPTTRWYCSSSSSVAAQQQPQRRGGGFVFKSVGTSTANPYGGGGGGGATLWYGHRSHYTYDGPGTYDATASTTTAVSSSLQALWQQRDFNHRGFTVGIGGPVGSGKTATVLALCRALQRPQVPLSNNNNSNNNNVNKSKNKNIQLGVVTNDIFTQEDAEFLQRHDALPSSHHIRAVETGGCPHAAIREDVSANLNALEQLTQLLMQEEREREKDKQQQQQSDQIVSSQSNAILLLCESGGDNLAANFSRELADLTLYVIDVAGGDKVPRKGGPGITQSDLLVINKIDLAEAVGADLNVMRQDANCMRTSATSSILSSRRQQSSSSSSSDAPPPPVVGPTLFCAVKHGQGVAEICDFILQNMNVALSLHHHNRGDGSAAATHHHDHDHEHHGTSTTTHHHSHSHDHHHHHNH